MRIEEMGRMLSAMKLALPRWAPSEVTPELCNLWMGVLKDYSTEEISMALGKAISTLTEFPAPATLKRLCQGSFLSDEETGEAISGRIESAIRRFGYASPERAEPYIGPLGWKVVLQYGGWVSVCEIETDELLSARKMWRDSAKILARTLHIKGEDLPPQLPENRHPSLKEALQIACGVQNGAGL